MKKKIFTLIVLVLVLASCKGSSSHVTMGREFKIENAFVLLPIEESAKEVRMTIEIDNLKEKPSYFIRLAKQKIDYWVKIDVKDYIGRTMKLDIEGVDKSYIGIDNIRQSNRFEFNYFEKYRPNYHFTPEYGWTNDPNGMVYYQGEYHLFYQYNPYGNMWGNMHWGHAVSTDLTSWTYLPIALTPDTLGDIFSGSAVIDENNSAGFGKNAMIAIYTSNGKVQQQSLAFSTDRGRTFHKYEKNPVLENPGISDFRDPKVMWHSATNRWIMTLATKQTITFYSSKNLLKWDRLSEFGEELGAHGGVWECPDLFPLNYNGKEKWVLLVSINPGGPNGGSATQYFIGDFDGKTFKADSLSYPLWMDYGRDNYAGVTWSNVPRSENRRIFIGWMNNWDYANNVPTENFRGAMTIPRELKLIHNGKHLQLTNSPVKEVMKLRGKSTILPRVTVSKEQSLNGVLKQFEGKFELEMQLTRKNAKIFGFGLTNRMGDYLNFTFDLEQNLLKIDRRNCGLKDFNPKYVSEPIAPITPKEFYKVRLLVDKGSVEMFINDGEIVMSNIVFPIEYYENLSFFTPNTTWEAENVKVYKMN